MTLFCRYRKYLDDGKGVKFSLVVYSLLNSTIVIGRLVGPLLYDINFFSNECMSLI